MLRIAIVLLPFALGAFVGAWIVSRAAYRRFWSLFLVSAAAGTLPALRIVDRVVGTHYGESLRGSLTRWFGCAELGCGFVGNIAYALGLIGLSFAAGLVIGSIMFGHASYRTRGFKGGSARDGGIKKG